MSVQRKSLMLNRALQFIVLVVMINLVFRYLDQQILASDFHRSNFEESAQATPDDVEDLTIRRLDQLPLIANYTASQETQARFFDTFRQLLSQENRSLDWQHQRLVNLNSNASGISDNIWIAALAAKYEIDCGDNCNNRETYQRLLLEVDSVPVPALLIAASISSRFGNDVSAQKHRNLFSLWQEKPPASYHAEGIYPWRSFLTWRDSVRAFVFYVNTDAEFAGFRQARAQQLPQSQQIMEIREALLRKTPDQRAEWERLEKNLASGAET